MSDGDKRLQQGYLRDNPDGEPAYDNWTNWAADRIETLQARVTELKAERDNAVSALVEIVETANHGIELAAKHKTAKNQNEDLNRGIELERVLKFSLYPTEE